MLERFRSKFKRKSRGRWKNDSVSVSSTNEDNAPATTEPNNDATSTRDSNTPSSERNLWEVAGERLEEKRRIALDLDNASPVAESIDDVIKTTEEKYREYQEGGLKIRKRGGGQINIRDSATNIISYTLQAKDLVKALTSFDSTGYASSAWSVVSIGLTLIQNDIERRDDIFEASEYLADRLAYYAIFENTYRKKEVESDQGLEDALVELYIAVLEYAAEVKKAVQESAAARVLKSITALIEQPLKDLKGAIGEKEVALKSFAVLTADLECRKQAESILSGIDEAVGKLKMIQSQTRSLQDQQILGWLSTFSYSDAQNNTQRNRASNTGDWFLNSPEYIEWKSTPGRVLWAYGAVGCGKSVLCSTIIQDIEELCGSDPSKKFAYWYFQFSNDETQKVYNMTRSILRQLMPRTLPVSLVRLWEDQSHRGSRPPQKTFAEILDIILEESQDESFLIFDALDECPAIEHDGRSSLLEFIECLSAKHSSKLHILATSRPEPDIRSRFEQFTSVDLELGLGGDVENFVRDRISHGRLSRWDESAKERALKKLLDLKERRFRWADLQIKRLQESKNESEFIEALETIPATLEDTYRDILERLPPNDREAARTMLIWLSFSLEPLTLKTVAEVVSYKFPDDVVKTCTTSLVTVNISGETVRLAHFSVKEFFVCNETQISWYQFSVSFGHLAIANKAIDSLLETTEVLTKATAEQRPLLIYSAEYWDKHLAELGETYTDDDDLHQKVYCLFTQRDIYFNWMRLADFTRQYVWRQSYEELPTPLSSATRRGLESIVKRLIFESTDPQSTIEAENRFGNALFSAAYNGHLNILELLIKTVDNIPRGVIPTMLASMKVTKVNSNKLPIVLDLLWDKGCLHDLSRTSKKLIDQKIAESAATNRQCGLLLFSYFLDRKEKIVLKITEQLLKVVMRRGFCDEQFINLLLDKGNSDLNLTPTRMKHLAVSIGRKGGMSILDEWLDYIELDEEFIKEMTWGRVEVMELLLQKRGNEVRITQNVLIEATKEADDPQMISLLLERRDSGTTIDKDVFLAAAQRHRKGSEEVMQILLDECGSDLVIDDEILQAIARNEYEGLGMMKLLLSRQQEGFKVTEQTFNLAAEHNNLEMLELLVNNSNDSELPITDKTLIAVADNIHGESLIEYLFDLKGYDLPVSEDSLISIASVEFLRANEVLSFLLEKWTEIPVTDQLLEATCVYPTALNLLLDRRHDSLPIQNMIQGAVANYFYGGIVLKILLDLQLVEIDEWLIETVAGNSYTLEVIYNRNPHFLVTPKIVTAALRNVDSIRILLDRQRDQILITEDDMKAVLMGPDSYSVIRLLLRRLGPRKLPVTEDTLILAVRENSISCLKLFLEHCHDVNLAEVWQTIWHDPGVDMFVLADAAGIILQYTTFDISEKMLDRLPAEYRDGKYNSLSYPFDDFIRSCLRLRIAFPTTESALELIIGRSSLNTIDIFLDDHPDIQITEKHIDAGKNNSREDMDKDALLSLLNSKMSPS
ncbi:hypothetical protein PENSTE_c016G01255 [Penicillium steckii]|uniref:NACHT domain-containing protein n=1 Tax=Penicillium steckii TaxID=303698 RepID=A0A1V6SZ25_9EURO|nr:hypothetical protein PENSTE_c016G01255 [Penicillium steckii]